MSARHSNSGHYQPRRVGGLRPSQMIHTYGPGALVDLPGLSVVVAGTDRWDETHDGRIFEPRLVGTVRQVPGCERVTEFRSPPWIEETGNPFDDWARVGVPVHPFPRWMRCTRCDLLAPVDRRLFELEISPWRPDRSRYSHDRCHGRRPSAVPARFVIACPAGHLDDFPWEFYVHRGEPCPDGGPVLELKEAGSAGRATDVRVVCKTCNMKRLMHDAFSSRALEYLPRCRGRHPHLQTFEDDCSEPTRALLLGASNTWFAVYRSALTIPTVTGEIEQKIDEHWELLEGIAERVEFDFLVKRLGVPGAGERPLRWLSDHDGDDVWTAIVERRESMENRTESSTHTGELRGAEWEAFIAPLPITATDFKIRTLPVPPGFSRTLAQTVAVDRLREVQALCGFTRIDSPGGGEESQVAPIRRETQRWLPAAEVRGEGILVRLAEARVEQWERHYQDGDRYRQLAIATRTWRQRRNLSPDGADPAARFVLLHSLSHILLHQVALECGYFTASIRERLYCREPGDKTGPPMAGILLYTGSPDSEGTLGGLVALAEPKRLAAMLRDALERTFFCSTDPMCADHHAGDQSDTLHNAACHSCLFVPETSCEAGNRYLDRAAVTPILGDATSNYFHSESLNT